jgi:pimeloyl-ACP methyl ester carboxylesterase
MTVASSPLNSTNVRNAIGFAWQRLSLAVASTFAPEKAVNAAVRLFMTPPRIAHTARELEFLETGTSFIVKAPSGAIAAWRFGRTDRPVVLLVHGWGGRGAQLRTFVAPLLESGYQVVLYDNAGHGRSDGERSTLIHFVSDLDAVVRQLESKGATVAGLIGHSLGAAAVGAWLNRTRRDLRAVLVAPPTSVERYSSFFARKVGISEPVRREMQRRFEMTLGTRWSEFELPQSVANVRAAALVIHDAGDRDVSPASGLALARAWPGARWLATRGLGHRRILRDPMVARDAADFIDARVSFAPPPAPGSAPFDAPAPIL